MFSSIATHSGHQVVVPAMVVSTGAANLAGAGIMSECCSAPATVLQSEAMDWSAADYKSRYAGCFDARRFSAMFSDGRNAIMYDRRGVKRDTDIGGCNRRWQVSQSY